MSGRYWESYSRQRRRPANGIKAQNTRGKFGQTWWAGRWIAALERLVDQGRLARGRTYARAGQVMTLDVGADGVAARVQGSSPTPYRVTIRFTRLTDAEWETVITAMASRAIYAAKLLSGEMPETIEEVFEAAGVALFPATGADLTTDCSCPDWSNPCKHIAAVHYLLGERFDADPFLMFTLRGRDREQIIAALRARRQSGEGDSGVADATATAEAEAEAEVERDGVTPDQFWSLPEEARTMPLRFEREPVAALAVKRLGPPPFWRDARPFDAVMEEAYQTIAAHAYRRASEDRRPPPDDSADG